MDSADLLAREDEFKKLNKQLEKKTESLMKQIEQAMQKQDIFSEFSHSLTLSPYHTNHNTKKHCCDPPKPSSEESTPTRTKSVAKKEKPAKKITNSQASQSDSLKLANGTQNCTDCVSHCPKIVSCECCASDIRKERVSEDLEFLYAFVSVSVQEKVLPPSFLKERSTVESVCKFLSSKVKLMQEQIDKLQATINKKAKQCEVHLTHQAELEGERLSLLNKCNNLTASATEMRAKYQAAAKKLEEKDRLYKEQRSEADKLSSEAKRLRSKNASLEARCASLDDSVDQLRLQLDVAKKAEKDFRDSTRSLSSSHQQTITKLETRIKNLTARCQKQEKLIQNLRDQRSVLIADGALKSLEKEYNAFIMRDF
ncbi:hypothetical protein NE865_04332 [Phthorimaea operculella]|nr:hypothetical protein NE865_04332 [Phthorimaea operculella]